MIMEPLLVIALAIGLDLALGDPRNRFHPTAWIGRLIGRLAPFCRGGSPASEKTSGALLVLLICGMVLLALAAVEAGMATIPAGAAAAAVSILAGGVLLKVTIAIRGMERHAMMVVAAVERGDLDTARQRLALIVKRDTTGLDRNHVLSGTLESVSENTVDGITGPLFYFGIFGIFGAFAYRVINTFDSMMGYKTPMFRNLGWFAARCDSAINYVPARLTGLTMIAGSFLMGRDWRQSYKIMIRDSSKPSSLNAGYPMAALAGSLNARFEKTGHYAIGDGDSDLEPSHVRSSITLMKISSLLFCCVVTAPAAAALYYAGWWLHA